ncbi:uncharacterized protein LOC136086889 [Hydra vulgaris]|uniref:Uncharacterized protein LOC136086889 n=1 Tax=Hydra vulgaris TaxID=6087 RepID=A0ABM4CU44_HYDVU
MPAHLSKIHSVKRSTSSGNMKNRLFLVHKIVTDKVSTEEKNNIILKNWCSVSGSSSKAKFDITRIVSPSRSSLACGALIDMFKAVKSSVKDVLKYSIAASLLFDGWTDKYKKLSYIGVKCSVITSEWDRNIFTLACTPLENHTAENIAYFMKNVIKYMFSKQFGELHLHNVHDGAANMMKTSSLLGCEEPQHCLAHVLNLLLVSDVKELVNHDEQFPIKLILNENQLNPNDNSVIVDSEDEYEKNDNLFEENSKYQSKQHKSLKLHICSRWNSALFMTESIELLYNGVKKLLKKIGKREFCLDEFDLKLLSELVKFLKPFQNLTEVVGGEQRLKLSKTAKLSCLLDPAVKSIFPNNDATDILIETLSSFTESSNSAINNAVDKNDNKLLKDENHPTAKKLLLLEIKTTLPNHDQSKHQTLAREVNNYVNCLPTEEEEKDPVVFWKNNHKKFPYLVRLANEYLCIPSSSVPVESMFSTPGLIVNSRKSLLDPTNMNMIIFIHENINLL